MKNIPSLKSIGQFYYALKNNNKKIVRPKMLFIIELLRFLKVT